jgi:enoyl-CoA hydratase/carnithine racemase
LPITLRLHHFQETSSVPTGNHIATGRRDSGTCWVPIHRASKHNALARSVLVELAAAATAAGADPATRFIVPTGAGERFFAAPLDRQMALALAQAVEKSSPT